MKLIIATAVLLAVLVTGAQALPLRLDPVAGVSVPEAVAPIQEARRGRGADDAPGDDRGRRRGGKGADDTAGNASLPQVIEVARRGRGKDDAPGDTRRGRGRGTDDAPNQG